VGTASFCATVAPAPITISSSGDPFVAIGL
jgi:hypothetical protein